jgi:hypothetical protein
MRRALRANSPLCVSVASLLLSLTTSSASAVVMQPDGTQMPVYVNNGEISLQEMFDEREGEGVMDFQADADIAPATFKPLCDFTAELVLHETSNKSGIGWYNVPDSDVGPTNVCDDPEGDTCTQDDIFLIIPGDAETGLVFTGADIAGSKYYAGGEIGFVLLTSQKHYSETRLNPVCSDAQKCAEGEHWIPTIIYQSKTMPQSYYMCSEDQQVGANGVWGNNDGDFNDYVILFTGLVCSGSGEACDTGQPGICAAGLTDCADANGESACKPVHEPGKETCNAIDDDCDGEIDEGDLCDEGEICDRGRCVPTCLGGEFPCTTGFVCTPAGVCVEAACADVECEEGEICDGGKCKGACDDVVCPYGQVCFSGACIDPCDGVECGDGLVCNGGACLVACDCRGCEEGVCDSRTGLCVDEGCDDKECPEGTHCSAGKCVDDCDGAVCPGGAECISGSCMSPTLGAGGRGSGGDDGGGDVIVNPGKGGTSSGSGATGGDGDESGGALGGGSDSGSKKGDSGCGCRTPGRGVTYGGAAFALFALALALLERRRAVRKVHH